ncbi:MAG TPA: hypothetical protein VIQ30_20055 [Pseudonocardia sp.]
MVASLVTPTELIVWLDIPADTFPTDRATLLVNSASAAIRGHCGWNITEETVTGDVIDGTGKWDLWLPTKNLTAVASLVENGVTLVSGTNYDWYRNGQLTRAGRWTSKAKAITVTYTHGYPAGHVKLELARSVCLTAAARMLNNPAGLRSETVGAVSWTAAGSGADATVILTAGDEESLAPLALHGVA